MDLVTYFSNHFKTKYKVTLSGKATLFFDYLKITNTVRELLVKERGPKESIEVTTFFSLDKVTQQSIQKEVFCLLLAEKLQEQADEEEGNDESGPQIPKQYLLIDDISSGELRLYYPDKREFAEYNLESYRRFFTEQQWKNKLRYVDKVIATYDPFDIQAIRSKEFEGVKYKELNLYKVPEWRKISSFNPHIPEDIMQLLKHVIRDERGIDFFLDWVHYAIIGKARTFLILYGGRGIGKDILLKMIFPIIGDYYKLPSSFTNSQFNEYIRNKRILYTTEVELINLKQLDALKQLQNSDQTIEGKFKPTQMVKLFASLAMSNNADRPLYTKYDERSYSMLDLNKVRADKVFSHSKLKYFDELYVDDIQKQADFGNFLLNRKPKYLDNESFKGDTFNNQVVASLSINPLEDMKASILEDIIQRKKESYSVAKYREEAKEKRATQFKNFQIKNTFEFFEYNGKKLVKEFQVDKKNMMTIIPGDDFLPDIVEKEKEVESNSIDDVLFQGVKR